MVIGLCARSTLAQPNGADESRTLVQSIKPHQHERGQYVHHHRTPEQRAERLFLCLVTKELLAEQRAERAAEERQPQQLAFSDAWRVAYRGLAFVPTEREEGDDVDAQE